MTDFLRQRHEAISVVLETQIARAHCEYALRIESQKHGPRGMSMGALRVQAAMKKKHRAVGELAGHQFHFCLFRGAAFHVVRITRIAPRLLDSDNLEASLKYVRDGVAKALGIDDRDPRVRYVVDQRKGEPKTNLVRLELYAAPADEAYSGPIETTKPGYSMEIKGITYDAKPNVVTNSRRSK